MKNAFENRFYSIGWERANEYLYGNEVYKLMAEQIYERFCSQADFNEEGKLNENKIQFIRGWTAKLMD